jgi:hypothetical protein
VTDHGGNDRHADAQREADRQGAEIVVSNEFATVVVRKVLTRNGERLEITSPTGGRSVRLDALVLESLTWSDPLELGRGLTTPFGPQPRNGSPEGT